MVPASGSRKWLPQVVPASGSRKWLPKFFPVLLPECVPKSFPPLSRKLRHWSVPRYHFHPESALTESTLNSNPSPNENANKSSSRSSNKSSSTAPTSSGPVTGGTLESAAERYWQACAEILDVVRSQQAAVAEAADWLSDSILAGRVVHLFGAGHSRILVEEMWPRYGSFPGFNPIVELSLTFHNLVVGANGQRQAMYLENVPGLASRILRNFVLKSSDSALIVSSSGTSLVAVEMAEQFQQRGIRVVAMISRRHGQTAASRRPDGKKLGDFADLVLDTGAPEGDAMVTIPGLETPVSPGSTVGGCLLINALKAEIATRLTQAGSPPPVLTAGNVVGGDRSAELFESAYDEHARRMARLYDHPSLTTREP